MEFKNKYTQGSHQHYIDDEDSPHTKLKDTRSSPFTFSNDGGIKKNECHICNKLSNNNNNQGENNTNSIANELRISNLEKRLENTEKMLKFYEEMLRLKDEEKTNEFRIDNNRVNEVVKKINYLEDTIKILSKRNKDQNEINERFENIEKKFVKFMDTKNSIGDFYASKLSEVESLIKKNDTFTESLIDEKIANLNLNIDSKLEDMLNLVNDIGKSTEYNEFNVVESKENIRMIQNDHLDFIKILSILKEKSDSIDYIMTQISELKNRYSKIIKIYGEQSREEDKFFNKILGGGSYSEN